MKVWINVTVTHLSTIRRHVSWSSWVIAALYWLLTSATLWNWVIQ